MTTILITFCVSLVLSMAVLWNKHRELVNGRVLVKIGNEQLDSQITSNYRKVVDTIHHVTMSAVKQYTKKTILSLENFFIRIFHYLSKRFFSIGNVITGHNIPKNRGSVSFFLKNIEEHKKTINRG
jgi:hypothetical protein